MPYIPPYDRNKIAQLLSDSNFPTTEPIGNYGVLLIRYAAVNINISDIQVELVTNADARFHIPPITWNENFPEEYAVICQIPILGTIEDLNKLSGVNLILTSGELIHEFILPVVVNLDPSEPFATLELAESVMRREGDDIYHIVLVKSAGDDRFFTYSNEGLLAELEQADNNWFKIKAHSNELMRDGNYLTLPFNLSESDNLGKPNQPFVCQTSNRW